LLAPLEECLAGAHDGDLYIAWPRLLELSCNFGRVMWIDALECLYNLPKVSCRFSILPRTEDPRVIETSGNATCGYVTRLFTLHQPCIFPALFESNLLH